MCGQFTYPYRVCRLFNFNQGVHMQLSGLSELDQVDQITRIHGKLVQSPAYRLAKLMGYVYERLYRDLFVLVKCGQTWIYELNVPESGPIEYLYILDAER